MKLPWIHGLITRTLGKVELMKQILRLGSPSWKHNIIFLPLFCDGNETWSCNIYKHYIILQLIPNLLQYKGLYFKSHATLHCPLLRKICTLLILSSRLICPWIRKPLLPAHKAILFCHCFMTEIKHEVATYISIYFILQFNW